MSRLLTVVGTRPQILKYAALRPILRTRLRETLLDTGQHYDAPLAGDLAAEYGLPAPDITLHPARTDAARQLDDMRAGIVAAIDRIRPDLVLCLGDTNSTLAAALAAEDRGLPLAHLEAGERALRADGTPLGPDEAPEEFNRRETDRRAALLLCATELAARNLAAEGHGGTVCVTGDIMYDLFLRGRDALRGSPAPALYDVQPGRYIFSTVHRQSNTGDAARLTAIITALTTSALPVVLPLHPRTQAALEALGLYDAVAAHPRMRLSDPVGHAVSLALCAHAAQVVTDSGGVTREAYFCGVPSVCVDDATAWFELVRLGWCALTGADAAAIQAALARPVPAQRPPLFGDGRAAERIVDALARHISEVQER